MSYKIVERNFDKVQFEKLRKKVDKEFNDIHDELSIAYYDYWKKGLSKPVTFKGKVFDVQSTLEESKALFDEIHGVLFDVREIEFDKKNKLEKGKDKIKEEDYKLVKNEQGEVVGNKLDICKDKVSKFKAKYLIDDKDIPVEDLVLELNTTDSKVL